MKGSSGEALTGKSCGEQTADRDQQLPYSGAGQVLIGVNESYKRKQRSLHNRYPKE